MLGVVALAGCNQAQRLSQNGVAVQTTWMDNAVDHRGSNGVRFSYVCPSNPTKSGVGTAWGTDLYSDDSSVCAAAVHTGAIAYSGGTVTIEIRGDAESYAGSARNGVITQNWDSWHGSFVVL